MNEPELPLPPWAGELIALYESGAASQFILHGNVQDHALIADGEGGCELGDLPSFVLETLLPDFDVVLSYDLGNGVRILRGRETLQRWPSWTEPSPFPRQPREALDRLTHYLRYCAHLRRMGSDATRV